MAMVKTSMLHMELEDTTELEDTKLEDTYDMGLVAMDHKELVDLVDMRRWL